MKLEYLQKYKCVIKLRSKFNGNKVKENLLFLEGKEFILEALWLQNIDDKYPGEWAMGDFEERKNSLMGITNGELTWVSSGDVQILEKVDS